MTGTDDKFGEFVLAFKPIESRKCARARISKQEYWIKLTSHTIQNWCVVPKQDLVMLSVPELVDKYTAIRNKKEKEYGM